MNRGELYEAWQVLGLFQEGNEIAPEIFDQQEIRRAYAGQLKNVHPEEDAEGFVRLQEAYAYAMQYAKLQRAMRDAQAFEEETDDEPEDMCSDDEKTVLECESDAALETEPETRTQPFLKMQEWETRFAQWLARLEQAMTCDACCGSFLVPAPDPLETMTFITEPYTEPEELRVALSALFSDTDAQQFAVMEETVELLFAFYKKKRVLLPQSLAQALYRCYARHAAQDKPREQEFLVHLMKLLTFYRRLPEYNCSHLYMYEQTDTAAICETNREFWLYFLAYGYGCRHAWSDSAQTLTAYIEDIYRPSIEWRKRFTQFGAQTSVSYTFHLADGSELKAEFHLFYVLYEKDGAQVCGGVPFSALCAQADAGCSAAEFFFLLGVTDICAGERSQAKRLIQSYLERLPLYEPTIPIIAECLSSDCEPKELPEHPMHRIVFRHYAEDARFCFQMQATPSKFQIFRYTKNGWEDFPILNGDAKAYRACPVEERPAFLEKKLAELIQPLPRRKRRISLLGKTDAEKAELLIDAMCADDKERRAARGVYKPFIPDAAMDDSPLSHAMYDFFAELGGYLCNNYALLRLGTGDAAHFGQLFTVRLWIFGCYAWLGSIEGAGAICSERLEVVEEKLNVEGISYQFVGRLGWCLNMDAPYPFVIGSDGKFYSCRADGEVVAAERFADLLYTLFDFSEVTAIELYEGVITVSKWDGRLEYCYSAQDFDDHLNWDRRKGTTPAERFSDFHV